MAKQVNIRHIELLLEQLSSRTKQSRDHYGYGVMSEMGGGWSITRKYLYERLDGQVRKAMKEKRQHLKVAWNKLDEIAAFLGFAGFDEFIQSMEKPVHPLLLACAGNYYCYVRRSSSEGVILQSPVIIEERNQKIWLTLKGPEWMYEGEVTFRNGCVFCLMTSSSGKAFHHVYRLGTRRRPLVMLGVFSGISTAQEPIGGRVVLVRMEEKAESMSNQQLLICDLKSSGAAEALHLAEYFESFEKNNLRLNRSVTFDLDDLRG